MSSLSRRAFIALPLGLLAPMLCDAFATSKSTTLLLYDASNVAARRHARACEQRGLIVRPIEGDRIRFGRTTFAHHTCESLVIASRYADFLLLSDVAGEAGYRRIGTRISLDAEMDLWVLWRRSQ